MLNKTMFTEAEMFVKDRVILRLFTYMTREEKQEFTSALDTVRIWQDNVQGS